ncbi:MAG: hypothetical protein M3463_23965 [Verrucomicrobiota bacterium]|nr:hypothetical protein [Verrucomicrobiota bacterium]
MTTPQLQRLLDGVARRRFFAALATNMSRAWLCAAACALAVIALARLLSLIPASALPPALWTLAVLPVIIALAGTRRLPAQEAARLVDQRNDGKELFLTATLIDAAQGEFQPVVVEQAERRAGEIKPAHVVPFRWQRGARDSFLALVIVVAAVWFLPKLDPFKKEVARQRVALQEQQLAAAKKATEVRREELAHRAEKEAEAVKEALAQLEKTFKEAKPLEREANLKQLSEQQKEIGELWKKVSQDQLKDSLEKAAQSFGQADPEKLEQWREEMKQGEVSGLKKELQEMREQLRQLAGLPASAEKRAQQQQLAQRLGEMAQAMKQLAGSSPAAQALQRALEQLDLSKLSALSQDATQAALDSLNLSEQELAQLAQSLMDGKQLEQALKNLQMAKQLADLNQLDGQMCEGCNGMGDYASLFAAKFNGLGLRAGGPGMGPGLGSGAKRPEDDSVETAFKPEKSSSQLAGGKMLLEWNSKELGETGARTEEYREAVRQVKQGVAEAIQREQVPPGYHDTIKRYFDTLPEKK